MSDTKKQPIPFGFWPAAVTASMVTGKNPRLSEPCLHNDQIFWLQTLPEEKGRVTIMMHSLSQGQTRNLLPRPLSAKSKVHEYGGGSYCVHNNMLYFVLADDQQIYAVDISSAEFKPTLLTPATTDFAEEGHSSLRYADLLFDPFGQQIIAVCEQHFIDNPVIEPVTRLVSIDINKGTVSIIADGHDFFASAALSPSGDHLVWLSWDHPHMPWDSTYLYKAQRCGTQTFQGTRIAGDGNESLFQPQFAPSGDLFFVSDRNNWWNLYRISAANLANGPYVTEAILPMDAEFATPQWTFNMSTYGFLNADTLLACYTQNGNWTLATIDLASNKNGAQQVKESDSFNVFHGISCEHSQATFIGASPQQSPSVMHLSTEGKLTTVTVREAPLKVSDTSIATNICFPTGDKKQHTGYGFYYAPLNANTYSKGKPPLIVLCHGGPTGATERAFDLNKQFWTNRGFAVIDVNYRGSTGFGRQYRQSLHNQWGVFDVEDVCTAAEYAVQQGWADPNQLIIKGSSAGGYTVLAALTFSDTFSAGVSLYGIGDLDTLVRDTHKFEARYLDSLIGDYSTQRETYYNRSPVHFSHQINCPLLVFQGMEDKVVPPNQAEAMVSAVRAKGLRVRYVTFTNEGHGFRNADNIETMLEEELLFYRSLIRRNDSGV